MAIALTVVFRQYYKMSDETKQLKQFILDSKLDHKLLIFTIKTNTNINMEDVDENLFRKEFSKNEIIRLKQLYPSINVHIK